MAIGYSSGNPNVTAGQYGTPGSIGPDQDRYRATTANPMGPYREMPVPYMPAQWGYGGQNPMGYQGGYNTQPAYNTMQAPAYGYNTMQPQMNYGSYGRSFNPYGGYGGYGGGGYATGNFNMGASPSYGNAGGAGGSYK